MINPVLVSTCLKKQVSYKDVKGTGKGAIQRRSAKTEGHAAGQTETREVRVLDGLGNFKSMKGRSSANKRKREEE